MEEENLLESNKNKEDQKGIDQEMAERFRSFNRRNRKHLTKDKLTTPTGSVFSTNIC